MTIEELLKRPVIPVIVIEDAQDAEPLAEALLKGGMDVIEVTCRTSAAEESIKRIKKAFPQMLIGAGTVVTPKQAEMCLQAGVDFGLAPGLNPETVKAFQSKGVPFIPGVMTPSEVEQGIALGCKYLKFYPAEAAGGAKMLKNLYGPYSSLGLKFCPTGGLNVQNMRDYLSLPFVGAIGGSWLATKQQIKDKAWSAITEQVKKALAIAEEVRGGRSE